MTGDATSMGWPAKSGPLRRWAYRWCRAQLQILAVVCFGLRCNGRGNIPREGGALICANHQSYLDPVLVGMCFYRPMNYIARKSLFRSQAFARLIEFFNAIPLDREGSGLAGLKETLRRVRRGEFVLLFPEGTRTRDGEIGPVQPGFCAVARRGRVPLVPVGCDGAYQSWPRTQRWPGRERLRVSIGTPLSAEEVAALSDEDLQRVMAERLRECLAEARRMRHS